MTYFIVSISALSLILLVLIVFMLIFLWRNHKRKTRYAVTYFIPVLIAIVSMIYIYEVIFPVYSDVVNVVNHNYIITNGSIEEVSDSKMSIRVNGEIYSINPMDNTYKKGDNVKIKYTPNSKYVISISMEEQAE